MRIKLDWFDERLSERITAIAAGRLVPAAPRDAATIMVLRQAGDRPGDGVEVLMLRRPAAMAFAPGAYVFPGGSVDAADADPGIGWAGPGPREFGERFGAAPDEARALACAAVRETFEESGILLATRPDGMLPGAEAGDASLADDRARIAAGRVTFAEVLRRRGLVIRADLLTPWARWITPEAEPRRFDARFFAAALPPGQRAVGDHAEAERIAWVRPAAAIAAAKSGDMLLLPPTATTLHEFAADGDAVGGDVGRLLASRRAITPVEPRLVLEDGVVWLIIPDDIGYPL